jgi:putative ATP-dependent endonuclease of OLD family
VLPALRDAHTDLRTWSRSPLADLLRRLAIEPERLQAVADTAAAATGELLEDQDAQALVDALNARLVDLVGDVFAQPLALGVSAARSDQVLRAIRVLVDNGRDLDRTSLGLANVIYLVLLLQQVAAATAAEDRVATILGVEEPEAHLHPHLQRVLFGSLLATQPPLVLTTHSAHIASVTPLRSLALLRSGTDGTTARTVAGAGLDDGEIADLERYLDVTRAEMLFARGVILVEGAAELFLIPAFAAEMGMPLDELGISVCAVHGTDFAPYANLIGPNGLDIPRVVATDGDADPNRSNHVQTGLKRARLLVGGMPGAQIRRAIDAEDWDQARTRLAGRGVFVGTHTLEVDMLPAAAAAMQRTMAELGASDQVQTNFGAVVAAVPDGSPENRAKLIRYIERYGKGRFAQRLAAHLDGVDPPDYIAQALTRLRDELA